MTPQIEANLCRLSGFRLVYVYMICFQLVNYVQYIGEDSGLCGRQPVNDVVSTWC